jgi:hypothetical protein
LGCAMGLRLFAMLSLSPDAESAISSQRLLELPGRPRQYRSSRPPLQYSNSWPVVKSGNGRYGRTQAWVTVSKVRCASQATCSFGRAMWGESAAVQLPRKRVALLLIHYSQASMYHMKHDQSPSQSHLPSYSCAVHDSARNAKTGVNAAQMLRMQTVTPNPSSVPATLPCRASCHALPSALGSRPRCSSHRQSA